MTRRFGGIDKRILLARLLIAAGLAMIGYYYGTGVYTFFIQKNLRQTWQSALAETASKAARPARKAKEGIVEGEGGAPIFGRLKIPRLGLDVIVLEGTDRATLTKGPGHIIGTAPPWKKGNTAISGHRTTFGAPFARLDRLRAGDKIFLQTAKGDYAYKVAGRAVVKPTDVYVIGQRFTGRLTLTTCDPPGTAVRRLAVWAER